MKIYENQNSVELVDNSVELADISVEFHKKSATHVILLVFYHLITIPCHLHKEIKGKKCKPLISIDLYQKIK